MTLDRANVTVASRVMLPTYPVFFVGFGSALLLTPARVMQATPAFHTAAGVMPLPTWGGLLIAAAVFQVFALLVHRRSVYIAALSVAFASMVAWAVVFAYAAASGGAPWTAPMWPAFIAVACYATIRSLEAREV